MFVTSQRQDAAVSNRLVAAGLKRGRSSLPFQEQEEGEAEEEVEDSNRWAPKSIPGDGECEVADRWRQYPRQIPMGADVDAAFLATLSIL